MAKDLLHRALPFLQWTPLVNKHTLRADLLAGLTGAIIVLPQGIAFALIAGLPPIYGLYTAIITPIVAALFGSSRHLVSGPTTTSSIAVFATVSLFAVPQTDQYIMLALTLTVMVGIIQFSLGLARLGALVNFISHAVITGYTAGAAILIATHQLSHLLGMNVPSESNFWESWAYLFTHISDGDLNAQFIGIGTIIFAVLCRRLFPRLPYLLLAMLVGTGIALAMGQAGVEVATVGSMPRGLPSFGELTFNFGSIRALIPGAFAVAMLGAIEVITISRTIAARSGQQLKSNQEFIGLGLSNIVGGFFSCYAGSGSFTRSGLNYEAGAKTPFSAIAAALILAIVIWLVAPLAAYLPMATMGGIIILVAYSLIDFKSIKQIFRAGRREVSILLLTMLSTLLISMQFAILIGVFFSLVYYLMRTSKPKIVMLAPTFIDHERKFMNADVHGLVQCPQLHVIRIDGSMFFGAIENIRAKLYTLSQTKQHILIVGSGINFIDTTGAEFLVVEAERLKSAGGGLYFSHLKITVRDFLKRGYASRIGEDQFFFSKEAAIASIYSKLDSNVCATCTARIFHECKTEAAAE